MTSRLWIRQDQGQFQGGRYYRIWRGPLPDALVFTKADTTSTALQIRFIHFIRIDSNSIEALRHLWFLQNPPEPRSIIRSISFLSLASIHRVPSSKLFRPSDPSQLVIQLLLRLLLRFRLNFRLSGRSGRFPLDRLAAVLILILILHVVGGLSSEFGISLKAMGEVLTGA